MNAVFRELDRYKPDIDKTIAMMGKTYEDALSHRGGNVTIRALPKCDVEHYSRLDLTRYNYRNDIDLYARDLCGLMSESFEKRRAVDDNMIPSVSPVLGIGDYSAFVYGDIEFQKDTSWSKPVLGEIRDFRSLPEIGTSFWYGNFLDICEEILKLSSGAGIPFMKGFFSPLDLAAALRGEAIYTDFYEAPEELHELLDYCADATIKFAEDVYALARRYLGGSKYGMWLIDKCIYMSEDIACMISPRLYRKFCAPHTQRVIDHFGTGHMHCHSRALYLVKEICSLEKVASLWIATDPNQPRPIENIGRLVEDSRGVCLAIDCDSFDEIVANMEAMRKGNVSICLPVEGVDEAVRVTEEFKTL